MTPSERFWLAYNAYHEARGEPFEGITAVIHVVLNRAARRGKSVKDIILAPWQFSWHNGGRFPPVREMDALQRCLDAVDCVVEDRAKGYKFFNADHYFRHDIPWPAWSRDMVQIASIGDHVFFTG